MSHRKAAALGIGAVLLLYCAATASAAPGHDAGPNRLGSTMEALPGTITYQGQLTDAAGNPLTGTYTLLFQVWDDATAGSQLGADMLSTDLGVAEGLFSVALDVPDDAFDGRALWLRIAVNGQWLSPRQPLSPAPYAMTLRPGAIISGQSADPVRTLSVINLGTAPALRVEGALFGLHALGLTAIKAEGPLGVHGSGLGPGGVGVRGITTDGIGLEGVAATGTGVSGTASGDGAKGVVGAVTGYASVGVTGSSQFGVGVDAVGETGLTAKGTVGFGVRAEGPMGIEARGTLADGISAETAGDDPAAAVRGASTTDAYGGHFTSSGGIAVYGLGLEGVHGESTSAEHVGVHGVSPGVGVKGESETGIGVVASSANSIGLSASAGTPPFWVVDGKYGVMASGDDYGVSGWGGQIGGAFSGPVGVRATSIQADGTGVHGVAAGTGADSIGVWGETVGDYGLYTAQKVYAGGGCVGCATVHVAQSADGRPLSVGDVVIVVGIAPPLAGHDTPRLRVRRAEGRDGLRGVVQSRADVTMRSVSVEGDPAGSRQVAVPSAGTGPAAPGDDLFVVLEGLAQVRVDAGSQPIEVGDALSPTGGGSCVRATLGALPNATPVGFALEPLARGSGLVWVLLSSQ